MTGTIEVSGFIWLTKTFAERGWSNPRTFDVEDSISGPALLKALDIPRREVESLIVNHRAVGVEGTVLRPGDRVCLVPPGVPGPHRLSLGIHEKARQGGEHPDGDETA